MSERQAELEAKIYAMVGREYGPQHAWDPVNAVMIRHWCEAMGDKNPIYTDPAYAELKNVVAPPTMLQAWTMKGYAGQLPEGSSEDDAFEVLGMLEAEGLTGVVAVNCDQEYERYLQLGEKVYHHCKLDSISEHRTTPLGSGYFVTVIYSFYVDDAQGNAEKVGSMSFRVLKFKPAHRP